MAQAECEVCRFVEGTPPGGWYLENEHWLVGPHMAAQVPGWVVVYLRRHAPGLADMVAEELESMGPALAATAAAIEREVDAERVYMVSFGENHRHVHVVLFPRGSGVPPEHRSSALHVNQKLYADPQEAARAGARIREALRSAPA
jgi:diadenosine tetraphosphate (Ap4A) HIT family hydrolase